MGHPCSLVSHSAPCTLPPCHLPRVTSSVLTSPVSLPPLGRLGASGEHSVPVADHDFLLRAGSGSRGDGGYDDSEDGETCLDWPVV